MRNRHVSRVCRDCRAPMARQEDTCWRCGVAWAPEEEPRTTLHLIPAAAPRANEVRLDAERWTNEGGSFVSAVAVAARR
jgi:hypothetical protein